jgi:hypothetical protein
MAYIDEEIVVSDEQALAMNTSTDALEFVKSVVWKLYDNHKHESLRIKIWGIPISVKLEKIEPFLTLLLGPNPYA